FSLWNENIKETHCLEGTWNRLVLDSILNSITHKLGKTRVNQVHLLLLLESILCKKTRFPVSCRSCGIIQEILFEETSGGLFVNDTDKFHIDRYKLFRFGHNSKIMMKTKLISENAEIFIGSRLGTKLRVFIMDQPGIYNAEFVRSMTSKFSTNQWMRNLYFNSFTAYG
ncbi:8444_t:CDS:2, partial [Gigaspora margarita]